ncbi:MAG: hypothetical protein ACO3AG_00730 [Fluviibacter sp.]
MDIASATPVNPSFNPPTLGSQVPGSNGGLPTYSGLMSSQNPIAPAFQSAQHAQSFGRGNDSMLIHMTPEEVNSLRGLAQHFGGDLTTNPHTGLPEAGWLGKLLPLIAGIGLNFAIPGLGLAIHGLSTAAQAGIMTGLASTAITGNLKTGLMAGLGAFGGASLAGGIQGALATGAKSATTSALPGVTHDAASFGTKALSSGLNLPSNAAGVVGSGLTNTVNAGANIANPGLLSKFGAGFANAARGSATGLVGKAAVPLAMMGVTNTLSNAMTPGIKDQKTGAIDNSYQGPYHFEPSQVQYRASSPIDTRDSSEQLYFQNSMPALYNAQNQMIQPGSNTPAGTEYMQRVLNPNAKKGENMYSFQPTTWGGPGPSPVQAGAFNPQGANGQNLSPEILKLLHEAHVPGYAEGGELHMEQGGFVIPARAVADAGNGYTDAGFERFAKLGGIPLRGKGDGVSDDIPARIGNQEARVAAGEVYMPPQAVARAGGAGKLYALVNKAHEARKRGQNSPVARGLGAL